MIEPPGDATTYIAANPSSKLGVNVTSHSTKPEKSFGSVSVSGSTNRLTSGRATRGSPRSVRFKSGRSRDERLAQHVDVGRAGIGTRNGLESRLTPER